MPFPQVTFGGLARTNCSSDLPSLSLCGLRGASPSPMDSLQLCLLSSQGKPDGDPTLLCLTGSRAQPSTVASFPNRPAGPGRSSRLSAAPVSVL